MKKRSLFLLLTLRTPYLDLWLSELNKNQELTLSIYYLYQSKSSHPWHYNSELPNSIYCDTLSSFVKVFLTDIIKYKPNMVILAGFANIRLIMAYVLLKNVGIPFVLLGDTPSLEGQRNFVKKILRSFILKWIFNNSQAVLTSGDVGINACHELGCPLHKLRNFPFPVDLESPLRIGEEIKEKTLFLRKTYAPNGEIIFLTSGRLSPEKGYDVALQAVTQVLSQNPSFKAILLLAGEGLQRRELEELARTSGLTRVVHFLGWQQPQELIALYNVADILVHPSRWDPYPISVLEAMAWGKPVLASDKTMAAVDRVKHGESGFIHRTEDSAELSSHMIYFLNHPERIAEMGAQARLEAEKWPISRHVQTILDLL